MGQAFGKLAHFLVRVALLEKGEIVGVILGLGGD